MRSTLRTTRAGGWGSSGVGIRRLRGGVGHDAQHAAGGAQQEHGRGRAGRAGAGLGWAGLGWAGLGRGDIHQGGLGAAHGQCVSCMQPACTPRTPGAVASEQAAHALAVVDARQGGSQARASQLAGLRRQGAGWGSVRRGRGERRGRPSHGGPGVGPELSSRCATGSGASSPGTGSLPAPGERWPSWRWRPPRRRRSAPASDEQQQAATGV